MLRSEHVIARFVRGKLISHRLSPKDERTRDVAEALVALYTDHIGWPGAQLEE